MTDIPADFLEGLKEKNLLIITPVFPNLDPSSFNGTFVKNQVDILKSYFKNIFIIRPVFRSFGIRSEDKHCKDYSYDNVHVFYPRCTYIPIVWMSKILIDNRLRVVEKTIKKYNLVFDIIHAHFTWPSGYIGIELKEKLGIPVVTTIHESGIWFDQEMTLNHPFLNIAWSDADALIRVNEKDVPILKRYNQSVYSIPNGFPQTIHPIEINIARGRLGLPTHKKIVFALGYLIPRKGFNHLIDSMNLVCDQRDDVICYIGGAGAERQNLQQQIDRLQLGTKVRLLGAIPNDLLPFWMNAADLFVLPSLEEGNPTVMFEVLGCGRPFVGTKVGGVPEVINSEEYGLLVEPGNSADLAEKILSGLNKRWDRTAILTYAEQYTWENIAKRIIGVYSEVSTTPD